MTTNSPAFDSGRDLLGPLFLDFCAKLHLYQAAYQNKDAAALYVARGGLRLRALYDLYLKQSGLSPLIPQHNFFASRVAVCKGCLLRDIDHVAPLICREFNGAPLPRMIQALIPSLRTTHVEQELPASLRNARADVASFKALLKDTGTLGLKVHTAFEEQDDLFTAYMQKLAVQDSLLIDTGWSGTTQLMLARRFPEQRWMGLYVGKWNTYGGYAPHFRHIVGITACYEELRPSAPGRTLFDYHHIIESPMEPDIPSTEGYQCEGGEVTAWPQMPDHLGLAPRAGDDDLLWTGILDYFKTTSDFSFTKIVADKDNAVRALAKAIYCPTSRDVSALASPPRSADFGKDDLVPVLHPVNKSEPFSQKIWRIRIALWRQGQIRLEFPRTGGILSYCYTLIHRNPRLRRKGDAFITNYLSRAWKRRRAK